jgi:hypothetical protein
LQLSILATAALLHFRKLLVANASATGASAPTN